MSKTMCAVFDNNCEPCSEGIHKPGVWPRRAARGDILAVKGRCMAVMPAKHKVLKSFGNQHFSVKFSVSIPSLFTMAAKP